MVKNPRKKEESGTIFSQRKSRGPDHSPVGIFAWKRRIFLIFASPLHLDPKSWGVYGLETTEIHFLQEEEWSFLLITS